MLTNALAGREVFAPGLHLQERKVTLTMTVTWTAVWSKGFYINLSTSSLSLRKGKNDLPKVRVTRCHSQDGVLGTPPSSPGPFSTQCRVASPCLGSEFTRSSPQFWQRPGVRS